MVSHIFKATPKYLSTVKYCWPVLKSETLVCTCGCRRILIVVSPENRNANPTCDVSCISTNIQDVTKYSSRYSFGVSFK